jgi:hypothetical protein
MDISSIQSTAAQAAAYSRTKDSEEVQSGAPAPVQKAKGDSNGDVASLKGAVQESPEMTAARASLRNIETLDDARRTEIQARLASGFYSKPETIEKVSAAMAEALTPDQGE